jgi:glycosyltransferase involved in cell wall biosynthesis
MSASTNTNAVLPQELVTVVIPVWGSYGGAALDAATESATHPLVKVLVVDNASVPPLRLTCDTVRLPQRVTLGASRNAALPHVCTPYVLFLDADDRLLPGALDRLLTQARRFGASDAVIAGRLASPTTGEEYHWPRAWQRRASHSPRIFALLESVRPAFPVQGSLLPTKAVRDAGGYDTDENAAEDWVLGVSLAWRCRVVFTSEPTMAYEPAPRGRWLSNSRFADQVAHRRYVRERLRSDLAATPLRRYMPAVSVVHTLGAIREHLAEVCRRRRAQA